VRLADIDGPRVFWRVGYHADPLGFIPRALCSWAHRFDDPVHRFRSVYVAELPETALREVLADYRANAAAVARYVDIFGPDAAGDVPGQSVTAAWRAQNVLAACHIDLRGPIVDLTDAERRHELERRHAQLLRDHRLAHLDLHQITTSRRPVTQRIAADAYDRLNASAIRFPSKLDGHPCLAIFEHRGELVEARPPLNLSDPPVEALQTVCAVWRLPLEPCPAAALTALRS
jgi:hypothetical protein